MQYGGSNRGVSNELTLGVLSAVSLARSTDTERLFSNIFTRVSTDCGFIAGSSAASGGGGGGRGFFSVSVSAGRVWTLGGGRVSEFM